MDSREACLTQMDQRPGTDHGEELGAVPAQLREIHSIKTQAITPPRTEPALSISQSSTAAPRPGTVIWYNSVKSPQPLPTSAATARFDGNLWRWAASRPLTETREPSTPKRNRWARMLNHHILRSGPGGPGGSEEPRNTMIIAIHPSVAATDRVGAA